MAWLCALNAGASLLIWLAMLIAVLTGLSDRWVYDLLALPGSPHVFLTHPWTIVTYMFAQANPLQLLFNMLWLVWFGQMLLDSDSDRTLLALYLGGGIAGGICYLAASALAPSFLLMGSSASVLSLMVYTAFRQPDRPVPLFLLGEVRLKWIALFTIVITFIGAAGVAAHCAHIGGMLFAIFFLAWRRVPRRRSARPKRRKPKAFSSRSPLRTPPPPQNPEQTLDILLDKVRVSGYASLSKQEKKLLDEISRNLDN